MFGIKMEGTASVWEHNGMATFGREQDGTTPTALRKKPIDPNEIMLGIVFFCSVPPIFWCATKSSGEEEDENQMS